MNCCSADAVESGSVNRKAQLREGMYKATHFLGDKIKGGAASMIERQMEEHMKQSVHDTIEWVKSEPVGMRQLGFMSGVLLCVYGFIAGIIHFFGLNFPGAFVDFLIFFTGGCACTIEYKDPFLPSRLKETFKSEALFVFKPFGRPLVYLFWSVYMFSTFRGSVYGYQGCAVGLVLFMASVIQIYHTFVAEQNAVAMKQLHINMKFMKNEFNKADASGDGSLDSDEFIKFLHAIDIHLTKDDLETVLLEVDESHDESVSFDEFMVWYNRNDESGHV